MAKTKTHWKLRHNFNYLGAYSLPDGKDIILTIKELNPEKIKGTGGREEDGFVCHVAEPQKPMIMNKTNCKIIEKIYGTPYIEDWIGKKIQIYVQKGVKAFGEIVDALRIREQIPGGKSVEKILAELYMTKKDKMKVSDQRNAERIIKEKETESYDKLRKELNEIKSGE